MRRAKATSVTDPEKLRAFLKSRSLKATPQRMAVHEALSTLVHASAEDIAEYISGHSDKTVTVSSIYNILNQFTELGLCAARLSQNNRKYFDIDTGSHIHLYDSVNHVLTDIPDNGVTALVESAVKDRRFPGYKIDNVEIVLVCHPRKRRKRVL